jgi:toxin ParE1/3/4
MKQLKINWTPQSQEDLKGIRSFIARDAPATAELFLRRLKSSVNQLRSFPEIGSIVIAGNPSVRQIIFGAYRILYRITSTQIDVLTVYHSARMLDESDL